MNIKELTIEEFERYSKTSQLKNYMQSVEYARFMGENGFDYEYIGLIDGTTIKAASLIGIKKLGHNTYYGYAPKGFLINYYDADLVSTFIDKLKAYYLKKGVVFIKINPEIVVAQYNNKTYECYPNPNLKLKFELPKFGFKKLKDNLYFESSVPRFNAYVDLKNTDFKNFSKANRNKIRNAQRKGLYLEVGNDDDLASFYNMINTNESFTYYKNLYNIFGLDKIELLLVKVSYEQYIKTSQELYEEEVNKNNLLNEILHRSKRPEDINAKSASDSKLCLLKNEIILATEGLKNNNYATVAAALVIKFDNRVHIVESGYDKETSGLNANYFLYNSIIDRYKADYEFLDLNGITGDFKGTNPYTGLNRFKLGFNPLIFEYIGEFDLVIKENLYKYLLASGKLAQEFNKRN